MKRIFLILIVAAGCYVFTHHHTPDLDDQSGLNSEQVAKGPANSSFSSSNKKKTTIAQNEDRLPAALAKVPEPQNSLLSRDENHSDVEGSTLQRVSMTPELWAKRISQIPDEKQRELLKNAPMPKTAIITSDDEPIVPSTSLNLISRCDALEEATSAITVSLNERGQVQDAMNSDPDDKTPIPAGIFDCQYEPYVSNGQTQAVVTALLPATVMNKIVSAAQEYSRNLSGSGQ